MAKSREGFTVHIKLSGKKNGTAKAVVKLGSALEKSKEEEGWSKSGCWEGAANTTLPKCWQLCSLRKGKAHFQ